MKSNGTAATNAFAESLNCNQSANLDSFLQTVQSQTMQTPTIINPAHLNLINSNLLQQQQQQSNVIHQVQFQQPQIPPSPQKDTTFTKIFVGGLPYHTTDESLKVFFQKFGNIEEAVVITDRQTGKSRGYGFVSQIKI